MMAHLGPCGVCVGQMPANSNDPDLEIEAMRLTIRRHLIAGARRLTAENGGHATLTDAIRHAKTFTQLDAIREQLGYHPGWTAVIWKGGKSHKAQKIRRADMTGSVTQEVAS